MKTTSEAKDNRLERKKKKLLAFLAIAELNRENNDQPEAKKPKMEETESQDYAVLKAKSKKLKGVKFRLREFGDNASLAVNLKNREPLFMNDIQNLILHSQMGHSCPYKPTKWCQLDNPLALNNTNFIILENVSLFDYLNYESFFPCINTNFDVKLEVLSSSIFKNDIIQYIATIPLTQSQSDKLKVQYGSLKNAEKESGEVFDFLNKIFPFGCKDVNDIIKSITGETEKVCRTDLLISGWQMLEEGYPLPIKGLVDRKFHDFVLTKDEYKPVTSKSPMFGVDCEMCFTSRGLNELTRVTIVDERYRAIYDELVKPHSKIVNYLTRYSGITANMMKNVTKRIEDVQKEIKKLLPADAIIVGHSLENDWKALKMMHPYNIDTSVIYNTTGERRRKPKLKTLMYEFCNKKIQSGKGGHCSEEDSAAALKLAKLKINKGIEFGDAVLGRIEKRMLNNHFPEMADGNYMTSLLKATTSGEKTASVVTLDDLASKYEYYTHKNKKPSDNGADKIKISGVKSNVEIVNEMVKRMNDYSLNIAHLKFEPEEIKEKTFKEINQWIDSIYNKSKSPHMNVVLFTGQDKSVGCCFINSKV